MKDNPKMPKLYNWTEDWLKLKVDGRIPNFRCFHCARAFSNGAWYHAFCSECEAAMAPESVSVNMTRKPVPLEEEASYYMDTNFHTGTGKPIQ